MNKQEVYDFLTSRGIEYEVTEHGAVFNMEEMSHVELPHTEADAKNPPNLIIVMPVFPKRAKRTGREPCTCFCCDMPMDTLLYPRIARGCEPFSALCYDEIDDYLEQHL